MDPQALQHSQSFKHYVAMVNQQSVGLNLFEEGTIPGQLDRPGNYIVVVAYPDGTNKVSGELEVIRGTAQELDFNY